MSYSIPLHFTITTPNKRIHKQRIKHSIKLDDSMYDHLLLMASFTSPSNMVDVGRSPGVGQMTEIDGGWRLVVGASPAMRGAFDGVTAAEEEMVTAGGGGVVGETSVSMLRLFLLHGVDKKRYQTFHFVIWFFKYRCDDAINCFWYTTL